MTYARLNTNAHSYIIILIPGKFSRGANFRAFRAHADFTKIRTVKFLTIILLSLSRATSHYCTTCAPLSGQRRIIAPQVAAVCLRRILTC